MKIDNEKLKEYFLIFLPSETYNNFNSFVGWKVIGSINIEPDSTILTGLTIHAFQTDSSAWPEEFKIAMIGNNFNYMVLVSQECPEVYFTIPEEILDKLKNILVPECIMENSELLKQLQEALIQKGLTDTYNKPTWYGDLDSITYESCKDSSGYTTTSSATTISKSNYITYSDGTSGCNI